MYRVLLVVELLLLCGPAVCLLFTGVFYLPALVAMVMAAEGGGVTGGLAGVLMVFGGLWGMISLLSLAFHVLNRDASWPGRPIQWFGLALGVMACIVGIFTMQKTAFMLVFSGPMIAAAHLLYLSKKQ